MSVNLFEVGKTVDVGAFFDISGATNKEVFLEDPGGAKSTIPNSRVTAPAVDSPAGYPANTYMRFTTLSTDFTTTSGDWTACCHYEDATPKDFSSDIPGILTIGEGCLSG